MAHSLQGVYAPLPQSLSDSDSEKEVSMEPVCVNYTSSNSKTGNLRHFSSRQNGHPVGFNNINDNGHKVKRINPKMTTLRKTAFVVSILLCFLPIIIFLWVLPCSESNTCPVKISNWETIQNNIELQGKINLVHGAFKNNLNLALRYKGSFNAKQTLKNGIMSFVGKNGAVAWDFEQESYPTEINCSIIDVNNNGYNDCLVIDERGLKAIDSVTGESIWHVHSAQEISIREMDMPVKLIDINKDDVPELLAIYKKESFLLISGKDGVALSNIKIPSMCILISNLTSSSECIRYCCRTSVKIEFYEVAISDLEAKFKNAQKNIIPKKYLVEDKPNMIILGDRKLLVTNNGSCPLCRATISLYCTNNTLLRTWSYPNSYAMMPVPFTLQSSDSNLVFLLGHIKGFILKIWQWQEHSRKLSPTTRVHRSIPVHNDTYHLNQVSESVMLIPFHENDIPIINISMTDIYLICNGPDHRNCQPDYEEQDNSLLIADLDHDKSIEVISYYSTFVQRDEDGYDVWYLVSKLKVFRLESELPKLYGIK